MQDPETSHEVLVADNPKQSSQIPVFIRILDINDHAPEFATYYETFVCENAKSGQVITITMKFINMFLFVCLFWGHLGGVF
jgi:hypothetical protein